MARSFAPISGVFEKTRGSGIWYVRYRIGGKLVRKKIGTRKQATDYLNKVKLIRATGEGVVGSSARALTQTKKEIEDSKGTAGVTFGVLCDAYLAWIKDESKPNRPSDQVNPPQRVALIKEAFGSRAAAAIVPVDITEWLSSLGKKPGTLNRYRSTFSVIFRNELRNSKEPRVQSNPVRDVPLFTVQRIDPRWLLPEEEIRLRAVLQKWIEECPPHHHLNRLYLQSHPIELTVALGTGLRKGNQYSMRWENVDFTRRTIHVPKTKNGNPLTLPMIESVFFALKEQRSLQRQINDLRDRIDRGETAKRERMVAHGRVFNIVENREWWKAALRESKIKNFRWHDLRHTFISRLAQKGVNSIILQEAAGHQSASMTKRYAHLDDATLRAAMSQLDELSKI